MQNLAERSVILSRGGVPRIAVPDVALNSDGGVRKDEDAECARILMPCGAPARRFRMPGALPRLSD